MNQICLWCEGKKVDDWGNDCANCNGHGMIEILYLPVDDNDQAYDERKDRKFESE